MKYIDLVENKYTNEEISSLSLAEQEDILEAMHKGFTLKESNRNNISEFVKTLTEEEQKTFYKLFFEHKDKSMKYLQSKGYIMEYTTVNSFHCNFNATEFENILNTKMDVMLTFAKSLSPELKIKHIAGIFQSEFDITDKNEWLNILSYVKNEIFEETIKKMKKEY